MAGPEVEIRTTGLSGGAPFTVYLAAKGARGATAVRWDFGDGGAGDGPGVYHTFVEPGLYEVRVGVGFADGSTSRASIQILTHSGG